MENVGIRIPATGLVMQMRQDTYFSDVCCYVNTVWKETSVQMLYGKTRPDTLKFRSHSKFTGR